MHYFHLLAAAKRPQASCLCLLALRQAEQIQPATSRQELGAFVEELMCSCLSPTGS